MKLQRCRGRTVPALLALLHALLASACSNADSRCGPSAALVKRVIDGDTVELTNGDRVRYLLVNTPESTNGHDECYGAEAREFNRSLVEGREVTLRYDEPCRDRFGRRLAYVELDGVDVNALLIARGYGCVLHVPPSGADRVEQFRALERQAKSAGAGLWGACAAPACE